MYGVPLLNDDDNFGKRFTFYHLPNGGVDSEYVYQRIQAHNPVFRESPYYPSRSFHRVGWSASSGAPHSWTNWICENDYYCRKAESSYKGLLSYSLEEEYIVKCIKSVKVWANEKYINDDINYDEHHSNPNNIALHQYIIESHIALYHHVADTY